MEVVYRSSAQEVLQKDKLLPHRDQLTDCSTWKTVQVERKPFWELRFRQFYSDGIHIGFCNRDVHEELHVSTIEQGPVRRVKLFPADIRKVHLAREILLHDLQHAPSMSVLARQSGLNTFKLKAGFKQVFGNSVFGYLKDHRLEQAKNMIREGDRTVTAVAYETGYSTLQHFSNEFKKKYGLSPKEVKGAGK